MAKSLTKMRKKIDKLLLQREYARQSVDKETGLLNEAKRNVTAAETAQEIGQLAAQAIQLQAQQPVASVVTRCLEAIFDDPYEFRIEFERKRGKTEASLAFYKRGKKVDPKGASGGGVLDVASFALRLAWLVLKKPAVRRVVVMDESFKFLHSPVYLERVRQLLHKLSEEMGVQFIIATGLNELETGTVIKVK